MIQKLKKDKCITLFDFIECMNNIMAVYSGQCYVDHSRMKLCFVCICTNCIIDYIIIVNARMLNFWIFENNIMMVNTLIRLGYMNYKCVLTEGWQHHVVISW